MRRFSTFLTMLFLFVWATNMMAQNEETFTRTVSSDTGTFTNKQNNATSAYKYMWQSSDTDPRLTLQTANNDMWLDSDGTYHLYIRTFTLSVPDGYAITGYSFDFAGYEGASTTGTRTSVTVTPTEGGEAVDCDASAEKATLSVTGLEAMQASFAVSSSTEKANIVPTNFTVTIKKVKTVVEMIAFSDVKDGEFGGNTVWYSLALGKGQTTSTFPLVYTADNTPIEVKRSTVAFGSDMLWCFSGNNEDGFTIYNRAAGATKVLASPKQMTGSNGGTAYPVVLSLEDLDTDSYETLWTMTGSGDIAGEQGIYLMQKGTGYGVNNRDQMLAFWTTGKDIGSTLVVKAVAADLRIGSSFGTFANKPGTNSSYMATFTSANTVPASLTLANGAMNNNMMPESDGDGARLYDATNGPTYNLSTDNGYVIDSYSFEHTGAFTTLEASDGVVTKEGNLFSVTDANQQATSFTIGANDLAKNFRVFIREGEPAQSSSVSTIVFDNANSEVPYRIPGLAQLSSGRLLAICDYRISKTDIGYNNRNGLYQIDEVLKYSDDGGRTWSESITFAKGNENATEVWRTAFGDPSIVVDRESDEVLIQCVSGKVGYFASTRSNPQNSVFFRSTDGGMTWDQGTLATEMIYGLYDGTLPGGAQVAGIFLTSGKIMQSRYVKVGDYYRLYIAHPMRSTTENKFASYVIYSDDFGRTWKVLGGAGVKPTDAADESKIEELPDGSVLLSSRNQSGGRKFNIFQYTDRAKGEGTWSTDAMPSNMTGSYVNACNGEILVVPAKRVSDGKQLFVALQSVPLSSTRDKVGFFYKELASYDDYNTGTKLAANWVKGLQVTNLTACYSTMIHLQNDSIGFLYEESAYNEGYDIVYKELSLDTITGGKYVIDTTSPREPYMRDMLNSRVGEVEPGTAVGMCSSTGPLDEARAKFEADPTDDNLFATIDAAEGLPRVELQADKKYYLSCKARPTYFLSVNESSKILVPSAEQDSTQLFTFIPTTDNTWLIRHEGSSMFIGRTGYTSISVPVTADQTAAYPYEVASDLGGWSLLTCTDPRSPSYPCIALNRALNVRPQASTVEDSMWRIQPKSVNVGIDGVKDAASTASQIFDIQGRRLQRVPRGVSIIDGKKVVR